MKKAELMKKRLTEKKKELGESKCEYDLMKMNNMNMKKMIISLIKK
jgi:hypothetical protein